VGDRLDLSRRKQDHLELCAGPNVAFREKTTLFEHIELVHCALPELHAKDVDTQVELLGKRLEAPVVVSGMTGGTEESTRINRDLARCAEELGLAFGLGSQRAMFERPETAHTFEVRKHAPSVLLLGNLGIVQAAQMSTAQIRDLCGEVGSDALCIHLNPAMEMAQPGGDRDFRGGLDLLGRLVEELDLPVVAKETGCGISRAVAERLRSAGVTHIDVGGAGGTSWVGVEAHRAIDENRRALAEELWDWGIPTAACLLQVRGLGLDVIATGGIRTGLDVAKAVALGAAAAGLAAPVLRAYKTGGFEGAQSFLQRVILSLRSVMLLTGSQRVDDLRRSRAVLSGDLARWEP
jgi:isopentenyl-diphosphate delta-isomerase